MIRSLHGDLTYQIAHRLKKHVSYGDLQMFENSNTESLVENESDSLAWVNFGSD